MLWKIPKGFCVAESEYFVDKSRNLYKMNSSKREKSRQFHENFDLLRVPGMFPWIMVVEIRNYRIRGKNFRSYSHDNNFTMNYLGIGFEFQSPKSPKCQFSNLNFKLWVKVLTQIQFTIWEINVKLMCK